MDKNQQIAHRDIVRNVLCCALVFAGNAVVVVWLVVCLFFFYSSALFNYLLLCLAFYCFADISFPVCVCLHTTQMQSMDFMLMRMQFRATLLW